MGKRVVRLRYHRLIASAFNILVDLCEALDYRNGLVLLRNVSSYPRGFDICIMQKGCFMFAVPPSQLSSITLEVLT